MANKAAIDFGNCNTVLSLWNETAQRAEIPELPEFTLPGTFLIPSVAAYEADGRYFIGAQAFAKASAESREFRWMKRYISLRSPYTLRIGERRIDAKQAAEDFLHALTAAAFPETSQLPDELILSVPVESFEHYSDWLLHSMKVPGGLHLRLIDEAAAAAAGYGLSLHPGNTLLIVDFGGSTLQAVCAAVSEEGTEDGRCCRVLGKAGCTLGGMTLDRWIFRAVLQRLGLSENDPAVHRNSAGLLRYCETVKKELSEKEQVVFDFFPDRAFPLTRTELDAMFRENGLYDALDGILEDALRFAEDHGAGREELTAVLPVGGSSLIPSVRRFLTEKFPAEKVIFGEPLGAVARGAAVIAGGMHIYDFIQHSYALRYTDPVSGEYAFRTIVAKGTAYPARQVTRPMKLKASFDGQQRFGIAIYELQENAAGPVSRNEVFFDPDGSVHVLPLTEEESRSERLFWMNEKNPLFLNAEGPAERGIPYFEIFFGIDENKMLLISARDMLSGQTVLSAHPVLRLV